ncbi:hypothetical protein POVCU2_0090280 [Plasmodium ovale curtisi]|uniref:PIR Superfamily Protein n=1 Tax=Plasmodium ovale curtisi TaxID=864141 RepID=A0A1A8WPD7_PLAOA|nr:hypothetical protein POVCU2_0090280 [Plasmodium ovale curtisi]
MADDSGYTTNTHGTPVGLFLAIIRGDIKNLIRAYGHKNCGLMHEELCKKIQKVISEKKKIVFSIMDERGRQKWNNDWNSQKYAFFNNLFEEEEFINMCFPKKKFTNNPSLNPLLSKHIDFCKTKDNRRAAVVAKPEYSKCVEYNSWIDTQRNLFTREYLNNVSKFKQQTVNKYFSTKDHPGGHDPRGTYHGSKLDCEIYNPKSNRYQKELVEKAPKNKPQLPRVPNIISGSQGKDGSSPTDKDSRSAKTEPENNKSPRPKSRTPDSQIPPQPKTQTDDTSSFQNTPVKTEALGSPVNRGEVTSPTPAIQSVPEPTATTSLFSTPTTVKSTTSSQTPVISSTLTITSDSPLKSVSTSPPDQHPPPLPPATKGQDNVSHSTLITSSDTQAISNPTKSVLSTKPVDSSLSQLKDPVLSASPVVTSPEVLGAPASPSVSTITTTVTTTTTALPSVTVSTMSTEQPPIPSTIQVPGIPRIPEAPPAPSPSGTEITTPAIDPQQTSLSSPIPLAKEKSDADASPKAKDPIEATENPLSKDTHQEPGNSPRTHVTVPDNNVHRTPNHRDQQISPIAVQNPPNIGVVLPPYDKSGDTVKTVKVNTKAISKDDSTVRTNKNDNPSIIPEGITPLEHIIPTLLVILATVTLLFQLYKRKEKKTGFKKNIRNT